MASGSSEEAAMTRPEATQRSERLRTLTEVSRALTYATSIEEILRLAVERAAELMGADKSVIMLTADDGLLVVRAAHGVDEDRMRSLHEPLTESLIERLQGLLGYPGPECFLSVPLVVQGEVTGLLAAVRSDDNGPDPASAADDEWLLSALADQAAVALENARLSDMVLAGRGESERMAEAHGRTQATLSHELRSPLTAIQAYADLLLEGLYGELSGPQRESVARIRMAGHHLLTIIENVLDATRLATGVLPATPTDLQVRAVLSEAADMVRPRFAEKGQELRIGEVPDLVVRADPNRVRQVLVNILTNANKYSPHGGVVEVAVSRQADSDRAVAAIAVTDNGRGIAGDDLPHIFEAYNRAGAPPEEPGLGLGLYICHEVVRRMGGEIDVSTRPGEGSTFTVRLPVAEGR
jgi:phosphoserine phosphatase RsbU/P